MSDAPFHIEPVVPTPAIGAALATLHAQCFVDSAQEVWSARAIASLLAMPATHGLVALDAAGTVLGFSIGRVAADEGEILTLCVAPAHRRQGVASALIARFGELMMPEGRLLLEVAVTNLGARELYKTLGFQQVGYRPRYYYKAGERVDALILAR